MPQSAGKTTEPVNKESSAKLALFDEETKKWYVPFVVEPSAGVECGVLAVLTEAYAEETLPNGETRSVLKLKKHWAPVKVAVIPLKGNQPQIMQMAHEIKNILLKTGIGRVMSADRIQSVKKRIRVWFKRPDVAWFAY